MIYRPSQRAYLRGYTLTLDFGSFGAEFVFNFADLPRWIAAFVLFFAMAWPILFVLYLNWYILISEFRVA